MINHGQSLQEIGINWPKSPKFTDHFHELSLFSHFSPNFPQIFPLFTVRNQVIQGPLRFPAPRFTGTYEDNKGKGELVEVFGFGVAIVDDQLRLGATPLGKPWPLGHWAIFRAVISRMKNGVFFFQKDQ